MTVLRLNRRAALGFAAAGPLLLPLSRSARTQTRDKLIFQTDWRAQAEHGGFYQAVAAGLYAKASAISGRAGPASISASSCWPAVST